MKKILEKLFCKHKSKILHISRYTDCEIVLIECENCGRLKKKTL